MDNLILGGVAIIWLIVSLVVSRSVNVYLPDVHKNYPPTQLLLLIVSVILVPFLILKTIIDAVLVIFGFKKINNDNK
jgi:hypothetical protein